MGSSPPEAGTPPFGFLRAEWPAVHEASSRAAAAVYTDPRTACFYARRALELTVTWAYKSDASLRLPYQDNLSALIHDPSFKAVAVEAAAVNKWLFNKDTVDRLIVQPGDCGPLLDGN